MKAFWQLGAEHNKVQFGVEGGRAVTQVKSHQGQKFHLLSSSGCGQCGLWTRKLLSSVVVCQELGCLIYFYAGRNIIHCCIHILQRGLNEVESAYPFGDSDNRTPNLIFVILTFDFHTLHRN